MLLEGHDRTVWPREFKLFESWLDRISTWADHDALVHSLIGPMIAADEKYLPRTADLGQEAQHAGINAPRL